MSMHTDWRYSDARLETRASALSLLLRRFGGSIEEDGSPTVGPSKIYACAHDWVSHGNSGTVGLMEFFEKNYLPL